MVNFNTLLKLAAATTIANAQVVCQGAEYGLAYGGLVGDHFISKFLRRTCTPIV